jgi:hypothetical protein
MMPGDLLFMLFHMAQRQSTAPTVRPYHFDLRGDVPMIPRPPDRELWKAEHGGKAPFMLYTISPKERNQARQAIARDAGTIERAEAIGEQVTLERICERVKTTMHVPDNCHVFFDPQDSEFWVYPS